MGTVDATDRQADEIHHLRVGLEHRTVIGQAQGILMAQLNIGADQAFDYLRRESMTRNRKLYDLAAEVVQALGLLKPERATSDSPGVTRLERPGLGRPECARPCHLEEPVPGCTTSDT